VLWAKSDLSGLCTHWLGQRRCSPEAGIPLLVRRYVGGCCPAARAEIPTWAGVPVRAIAPALDRLTLRRFRAEDGTELLDLPRAPLPDPQTPAPVRYLPTRDATLLVPARRAG